jgi:hypothetical protein
LVGILDRDRSVPLVIPRRAVCGLLLQSVSLSQPVGHSLMLWLLRLLRSPHVHTSVAHTLISSLFDVEIGNSRGLEKRLLCTVKLIGLTDNLFVNVQAGVNATCVSLAISKQISDLKSYHRVHARGLKALRPRWSTPSPGISAHKYPLAQEPRWFRIQSHRSTKASPDGIQSHSLGPTQRSTLRQYSLNRRQVFNLPRPPGIAAAHWQH